MVRRVDVQTCEDENDNMLHIMQIRENGSSSVAAAIQTANGVTSVDMDKPDASIKKLLKGNLRHRYTTTTDDYKQFLQKAQAAVKKGAADNHTILKQSTNQPVKTAPPGVGAAFTVAGILLAGGLTAVQQVHMYNTFMQDGVLSQQEIINLGFNLFEGPIGAAVDVVKAALGNGAFVPDLIQVDEGMGLAEHATDAVVDGAQDAAEVIGEAVKTVWSLIVG